MKNSIMSHMSRFLLVFATLFCTSEPVRGLAAQPNAKKDSKANSGKGFGASKEPSFLHTPDTSPSTLALIEFLQSQKAKGIDGSVVEIGIHKNGQRGLFATTNIKKDDVLCRIPSDSALALSDPSNLGEDAPTVAHGGVNFLKLYWNDPKVRQRWAPYLDTFPTRDSPHFTPTPDYFSEEEIDLLEFPRLMESVRDRKTWIDRLAAEHGFSVEELQFATWLVASRAFSINIAEGEAKEDEQYDERGQVIAKAGAGLKSIRVLVPFLDMVNHDATSPNCRFTMIDPEKDEAWFALEANRNIPAGREIKISYRSGIYSSVELLLNYGFVPEANKVDAFMLRKGGEQTIASPEGWTTTLEEDQSMLKMMEGEPENSPLKTILSFRTNLKMAYKDV